MKDSAICAKCKGARRLCGRPRCPLLARIEISQFLSKHLNATTIFGASPPSILVGEWNYPNISLGPNVPPVGVERAPEFDSPDLWWGKKSVEDIIRLRASMIYSKFNSPVRGARLPSGLLSKTQELALSVKPVETEVHFFKPPKPNLSFDGIVKPIGPVGSLKNFELTSNPSVPRKVDKLVSDTDAKSTTAITELYTGGISVYDIQRLLTIGLLGLKFQRKLVPTRWGITAVDASLGKVLIDKVKDYPHLSEIQLYTSDYLDNHYETLLLPGEWSFEMIEIWLPRSVWVQGEQAHITDVWERYDGKVSYMDGGYYCMRLPALEHLEKIRRQATVISFREVGPGYIAPLGSWAIRESVKNSFNSKPMTFQTIEEALTNISSRLRTNMKRILSESTPLRTYLTQKRLTDFVKHQ